MNKKKALSSKEMLFCFNYALLRDGRAAAAKAGYRLTPEKSAAQLLERKEIVAKIEHLCKKKTPPDEVAAGYRRLAFGSVADAVRLLCSDEIFTAEEIEKLDLFNVSDIKKPKGGGMEIKFFDRLKALEKLSELNEHIDAAASLPFYEALDRGAKAIGEQKANEQM